MACITERGTTYLKEPAFVEMIATAAPGEAFVYATGDVAYSAPLDPELFSLRKTVWRLYEAMVIALTQRACRKQFVIGGRAFDYIATKREENNK
jgi:hypothetical protein